MTSTNKPTDFQTQLAATINFYGSHQHRNELFVQVADVITTNDSFWFGLAFDNVSQTGVQFSLLSKKGLGTPTFSSQYANPGEIQFTGNGSQTIPLFDTPGYTLDELGSQEYFIHTLNGSENAFGTWGFVNGETRIMGGGVFELTFPQKTNLFGVDFADAGVDSV